MTAWEIGDAAARQEGDDVPVAAARSRVTPRFSPSPGIFKQLDPENTGTIQLDLISVSTSPRTPTWTGGEGCRVGDRDLWLVDMLSESSRLLGTGL